MPRAVLVLAALAAALTAASAASTRKVTLSTFAGNWIGHTRSLRIDGRGHAVEGVYDGCCDHVLALDFTLSNPRGTAANATATATVTFIHLFDPGDFPPSYRPPRVGQSRQVHLRDGVLSDSLSLQRYCDGAAEQRGACGA